MRDISRRTRLSVISLAGAAILLGVVGYHAINQAINQNGKQVEHAYVAFDVSPDGKQIVFSSAEADLYLLELRTRQVHQLTNTKASETAPVFSPDGKFIAYTTEGEGQVGTRISVCSLDGQVVRQLTTGGSTSDNTPSFSSDGRYIAFARAHRHRPYSMGGWTWDNYDVYIMKRDGSNQRRLTSHNYYQAGKPCFVNGGKTLVFAASGDYPDTLMYLFTVPVNGSQPPRMLTTPPDSQASASQNFAVWGMEPTVAPGGRHLAIISDRASAFDYDVWVMETNGVNPRPLGITGISKYNKGPVFTPDGHNILFLAGTKWNASSRPIFSLWEVGTDGNNAHQLADSSLFTSPLDWKPKP